MIILTPEMMRDMIMLYSGQRSKPTFLDCFTAGKNGITVERSAHPTMTFSYELMDELVNLYGPQKAASFTDSGNYTESEGK